MSLAVVLSRACVGIHAKLISVEVHISNGLPGLSIVGLPETAVKESKDRVRSALMNSGFEFPMRRITINLAPADLPKEGCRLDLPIALGILAASEQLDVTQLENKEFIGELALTGELRPVSGVLPSSLATSNAQRELFVPTANAHEASLPKHSQVRSANNLLEVCAHLYQQKILAIHTSAIPAENTAYGLDLSDIKGQDHAKRALEISAAGGHNLLVYGPPGTGKSMLAARLPSILPPLTESESLEVAAIHSVAHKFHPLNQWRVRPFRHPHHTASAVALVGGGSYPKPGEISLAHHGVLFLDELPEFERRVLEVLREPLETGSILISRAHQQIDFPAQFQLIAAMNPCPCGYLGHPQQACQCSKEQVQRYRSKISGPLLDRIDLQVEVPALPKGTLSQPNPQAETSAQVQARVIAARQLQLNRAGKANVLLTNKEIERDCALAPELRIFLETAIEKMRLSARAYFRILKVSRTLADLEQQETIAAHHIAEALSYRKFDRGV